MVWIRAYLIRVSRLLHASGLTQLWLKVRRRVFRRYGIYILSYHHVSKETDSDLLGHRVSAEHFKAQLSYVKKWFDIVSLEDALRRLSEGPLQSDCVVITFDDGYHDLYEVAFPILQELELPATVFLIAGLVGASDVPWYDECQAYMKNLVYKRCTRPVPESIRVPISKIQQILQEPGLADAKVERATNVLKRVENKSRLKIMGFLRTQFADTKVPNAQLMNWNRLREMASQGIHFGSHTLTHPILTTLKSEEIEEELRTSKEIIEKNLGVSCDSFAFPNGDFNRESIEILQRLNYRCACTQIFGSNRIGADHYRLKRIGVGNIPDYTLAAKLSGIMTPVFAARKIWRRWQHQLPSQGIFSVVV